MRGKCGERPVTIRDWTNHSERANAWEVITGRGEAMRLTKIFLMAVVLSAGVRLGVATYNHIENSNAPRAAFTGVGFGLAVAGALMVRRIED